MVKVITYGTYDLLHYGHIRLLERAKELGDYLIVGITASDFDKTRGKINVQQSLIERIEAVRATGLADEIIVEEYEGQKIDDIIRHDIDIFAIGSDWRGKFDYLNEFCKVVYLDRTQGVSSTKLRSKANKLRLGLVGNNNMIAKFIKESKFVNGIVISGVLPDDISKCNLNDQDVTIEHDYQELLEKSDAVYIVTHPTNHYMDIKQALTIKKHVMCESPVTLNCNEYYELKKLAKDNNCILIESIKTAYSTAYYRLLLMIKSGIIGDVISINSTCTSLKDIDYEDVQQLNKMWNSICGWGPTAMLPIFQILGTDYKKINYFSLYGNKEHKFDKFTKIDFEYENSVATLSVGKGIKSEGELIVSGTKGYAFVPSPWWKTDYFEIRYEDITQNKRYFYKLDGEGIRHELVSFVRNIENNSSYSYISDNVTSKIIDVIQEYYR